ncbi:hypothetical protein ACFE04_018972 [Oxalis oulophora]
MEGQFDFLNWIDHDVSLKILMCLDDPSDLVRVGAVSRSWRNFVVGNGLCKELCLLMSPQLSGVDHVIDHSKKPDDIGSSNAVEWEILKKEHRAYAFLARGFKSFTVRDIICNVICASSTDNFPEEGIRHTLEARERIGRTASYWSSKGQKDPAVPEMLTYKLTGDLCAISEISIKPFKAYFQWGQPIYSAKAVRFRMGHRKPELLESVDEASHNPADDRFVWTYTSEEFPMSQESTLQKFKLPEGVLCIGGVLRIELLGRVQRQEMDGLFYICVSHVQILGQSLSPSFNVEILEDSGKFALKAQSYGQPGLPEDDPGVQSLYRRVRDLEHILDLLRDHQDGVHEFEYDVEEESDEEYFVI